MIRVLLVASLLVFATTSAEEAQVLKPNEVWKCYAIDDHDKKNPLVELEFYDDVPYGAPNGIIRMAEITDMGNYSVARSVRRLTFGAIDFEPWTRMFTITPNGEGKYEDFSKGDAAEKQVQLYNCEQVETDTD